MGSKLPKLTKEEKEAFFKNKAEFFDYYGINNIPLYKKIASSLHSLACAKLYEQKHDTRVNEAVKHHEKACLYDPRYLFFKYFRRSAKLQIYTNDWK